MKKWKFAPKSVGPVWWRPSTKLPIARTMTFWLRKLKRICGAKRTKIIPAAIKELARLGRGKSFNKNSATNTKPSNKTRTISNCAAKAAQNTAARNHFGFLVTCKDHKQKNVSNKKGIASVTFESHRA